MSCLAHSDVAADARTELTSSRTSPPLQLMRPATRVLVVDDHPGFRRSACALLASEGFEVVGEADHGAAALPLADALEPDVVVLDVQLPDVDGFELASRLLERRPELAIVLISVRDRSDYGSLVEQSGARGFVSKADLSGAVLAGLLESQPA
jgi:DNA-binding NarL/FixJ family response regulator